MAQGGGSSRRHGFGDARGFVARGHAGLWKFPPHRDQAPRLACLARCSAARKRAMSWLTVLAVGKFLLDTGKPAAEAAINTMATRRPPEHNAVTYLLNARRR